MKEDKKQQLVFDQNSRFFEEYSKQGVNFWGLTVQNEPDMPTLKYEEMYYNASMER
jgi:O-glycosyl hydrolase